IRFGEPPINSITYDCYTQDIDVLLFSALGTDFWQLFCDDWYLIGNKCQHDFYELCRIIKDDNFIFINMGSAVILPEVFTKALAIVGIENLKNWRSHVVDFLPNQYRPLTRVAKYGTYFVMDHKEFLSKWLNGEIEI
ncbi:MAG: hypothetical protein Q8L68_00195, partial [Methylococcales bacterium]|nr:hypothetical protein [Methylococcales bacterium]